MEQDGAANAIALLLYYRSVEQYILGDDCPTKSITRQIAFRKDSDDVTSFLQKYENGRLDKLKQISNIRFLSPDEVTEGRFSIEKSQ